MEMLLAVITIALNQFSAHPELKADLENSHSQWQKHQETSDVYIQAHHHNHDYDQGNHQGQSKPWLG